MAKQTSSQSEQRNRPLYKAAAPHGPRHNASPAVSTVGAPILLGSTGNQGNSLISIDPATGSSTLIGPLGAFGSVTDVDCSPEQVLYGGTGGGSGNLITISDSGIETLIGNNGSFSANTGLEWVESTLYATIIQAGGGGAPSTLVTLNPLNGLATVIALTGLGPIGGLAYDAATGTMYGAESGGGSTGNLVTINLATGAAMVVGPTGFSDVAALDIDPSTGTLYGGLGGSDAFGGSLITINKTTGLGTLVGPTGFPALSGVTFCGPPLGACCEPVAEVCTNGVTLSDCLSMGGVWYAAQNCTDVACPPPPGCGGTNESFEAGSFAGWVPQDLNSPFFSLMVAGAGITPGFGFFSSAPTDGAFAALHGFDGDGPGTISIAEDVAIPAGTSQLEFDYRAAWDLASFGATLDRTFEVVIRPPGGGAALQTDLLLTAPAGTIQFDTGDLIGTVNVSAFAGQAVRMSFEWFVPEFFSGPAFFQLDHVRCVIPAVEAAVDIKPGSCPNPLNRMGHGVIPVALLGTPSFDPEQVDLASVHLARAEGVGGSVTPHEGPPGPHSTMGDVATPFDGDSCACHGLGGDGIPDLMMHFRSDDVVASLELDDLPSGALVELLVSGSLLDGTLFTARDCVRLVPPGTPLGLLSIQGTVTHAWIDAFPPDENLDGGDFANFERSYPLTSVVTLTAPPLVDGRRFLRWMIDGVQQPPSLETLELIVSGDHTLTAVYELRHAQRR